MTPRSNSQAQCGTRLREIENRLRFLDHLAHLPVAAGTPGELEAYERQVIRITEPLAGLITGEILQASLASETVEHEVETLVKASAKPLKKEGMQGVTGRTASGVAVQITTVYYLAEDNAGPTGACLDGMPGWWCWGVRALHAGARRPCQSARSGPELV